MAIGCAGFGLLILAGAVFFFIQAKKNISPSATEERMKKIMGNISRIGPENEVFEKLEQISPKTVGTMEMRISDEVFAGLSEKDPDCVFVHPAGDVVRAGIATDGKKRKPKYTLYIHRQQDGKVIKCGTEGSYDDIRDVLDEMEKANPKMDLVKYPG